MGSGADGIAYEFPGLVRSPTSVDGKAFYLNRNDANRNANVNSCENRWNDDDFVLVRNALHPLQFLRRKIGGIVVYKHLTPLADIEADLVDRFSDSHVGGVIEEFQLPRGLK